MKLILAQNIIDYGKVGTKGTSNTEYNKIIEQIIKVRDCSKGDDKVQISIENRDDVQKIKTVENE